MFLYLAFRNVELEKLCSTLKTVNYWFLVPAVLLNISSPWIQAHRWRYLLKPVREIRISSLFSAVMIGFLGNSVLPAKLGELVRAFVISRKEGISKSSSLATIAVERTFDGMTVVFLLVVTSLLAPLPGWAHNLAFLGLLLNIGVLSFLLLFKHRTERVLKLVSFVLRPLPEKFAERALGLLTLFAEGLKVLERGGQLVVICVLSALVWLIPALVTLFAFHSLGLAVPPVAALTVVVVVALGVMLPASPGAVGTMEYLCIVALALFGVEKSDALSLSLVLHASQLIPLTAIGLFCLWLEQLSLRELRKVEQSL
jgi:uncharacterized protein (TIRG00374 family)